MKDSGNPLPDNSLFSNSCLFKKSSKLHFISLMFVASESCLLEKRMKILTWWEADLPTTERRWLYPRSFLQPLFVSPVSQHLKSRLQVKPEKAICRVYGRKRNRDRPLLSYGAQFWLLQAEKGWCMSPCTCIWSHRLRSWGWKTAVSSVMFLSNYLCILLITIGSTSSSKIVVKICRRPTYAAMHTMFGVHLHSRVL